MKVLLLLAFLLGFKYTAAQGNTDLRKELLEIYRKDQLYREELAKLGPNDSSFMSVLTKQNEMDSLNLIRVAKIIDSIGYPGITTVGKIANEAAFYVIQHSNLKYQEKYLPIIMKAADNNELSWKDTAKMIDRIKIGKNEKQIYGTQLIAKKDSKTGLITNEIVFAPIEDPINVNKRRQKVGLNSIQEQAKEFGIIYKE